MNDSHFLPAQAQREGTTLDLTSYALDLRYGVDGIWRARRAQQVSYPAAGNSDCFQLEDSSFWFAHRNTCLLALIRRFAGPGGFFDIGGGNGFVASAIHASGKAVVLVEPGADGVKHAKMRGLVNVVQATLKEARFRDGAMPNIGLFDVIEHIDDARDFLTEVRRCLSPEGRLFISVPAGRWLWSDDDVRAGHFRRYTIPSLQRELARAGLRPLFMSKLFSPLPPALFFCRSVPSVFGRRRLPIRGYSGLHSPAGRGLMQPIWRWELGRLARGKRIAFGSSCLAVAEISR